MINLIARAQIKIHASQNRVWEALINPEQIKKYMFDTEVISDWKKGSSIIWKGIWQGKSYEDRGKILRIEPEHLLQYNHYSPMMDKRDLPENYHVVTVEIAGNGDETTVSLTQDNNDSEPARKHSEKNWQMMLEELKKLLENQNG
jgi:uncharacterized protein YndB with AHSA1/START domain